MPKPTYRIGGGDDLLSMTVKMSAGNPGALSVLMKFAQMGMDGFTHLLSLDDMGMSGAAIWLGFKDHCGEDFEKFKKCLSERDPQMVKTITSNGEYAVVSGDSFQRA